MMGFDQRQRKALRAKLRYSNVKSRVHNGTTLHYVEGWQVVAEANRIFGHENWDRETRAPTCIWTDRQRGQVVCLYSSQVRITVRAGETLVIRDGLGTGFGRASSPESAHEVALKAAETDATKRALATFGNPFGLALYDKEMSQVTRPVAHERADNGQPNNADAPIVMLTGRSGRSREVTSAEDLVDAISKTLPQLETVEAVYEFWENNLTTFASILERDPASGRVTIDAVTAKLKSRLREVGALGTARRSAIAPTVSDTNNSVSDDNAVSEPATPRARAKERRVRDPSHLAFVARQPCLVCGRRPAHAHHIRFAQPRALAMKVSDEYTIPLCIGHHDSVHRTGDERAWWAARKIDPIAAAWRLWKAADKSADFQALICPTPPDGETPDVPHDKQSDRSDRA